MKKEVQAKTKRKSVCIICGEEKDGLEVKEDYILKGMRWIKRNITKSPKNYRLVVCKEDFLKYKKKKDSYDRKQIVYVALGIIFLVMLLSYSSVRILSAFFYGGIVIIFLYLLAQLSYIPSVSMPQVEQAAKPSPK